MSRSLGIMKDVRANCQSVIKVPSSFSDCIWFEDIRSNTVYSKRPYKECEVNILLNVSCRDVILGFRTIIAVTDLRQSLYFLGIQSEYEIFNLKRMRYLEKKYDVNILLYEKQGCYASTMPTRDPRKKPYSKTLHLLVNEGVSNTYTEIIENFEIIVAKNLLPKLLVCEVSKKCHYQTFDKRNFVRHTQNCANQCKKKVVCEQKQYGDGGSVLRKMITDNYLPKIAESYRNYHVATFDIETIEQKVINCLPDRGTTVEANLKVLSIALGSNFEGEEAKCWVRRSSDPKEEKRLIKLFLKELERLYELKQTTLPSFLTEAEEMIDLEYCKAIATQKNGGSNNFAITKLLSYRRVILELRRIHCYGFNSARFDIPAIAAPLFEQLLLIDPKMTVLKKGLSYFSVTTEQFAFRDILKFTAPCSLDKFLKVWDAPDSKSIWPYSLYNSVEEIKAAKKFPPLKDFSSELKQIDIPIDDYIIAKTKFYRHKLLLPGDPNRIKSMYGWLKMYNILDVQPLAKAIENCFKSYSNNFNVNPTLSYSLPSLAQDAMYKNFDQRSPLFFSFPEKFRSVSELFRSHVIGGLVNVFLRHASTFDQPNLPYRARHTKNGDPITFVTMLDFNSMYLSCQGKDLPTSPGLVWDKNGKTKWRKRVMTTGHSLKSQQWLTYKQATDTFLLNNDGTRAIIHSKFHRGEKKILNNTTKLLSWSVDGYAESDQGVKIYEFLGTRYHKGCPKHDPSGIDVTWNKKLPDLKLAGIVEIIWEYEFDILLPTIQHVKTPLIPHILQSHHTESDILRSIENSELFGFVVCDLETPIHLIPEFSNFPPVIKRMQLQNKHLTEYMLRRYISQNPEDPNIKRETVVQCFNVKSHLIFTCLAKYYIRKGIILSNITQVIQYIPSKALKPFADLVTSMRIQAELDGKRSKANTAKCFGNSGYGKVSVK